MDISALASLFFAFCGGFFVAEMVFICMMAFFVLKNVPLLRKTTSPELCCGVTHQVKRKEDDKCCD